MFRALALRQSEFQAFGLQIEGETTLLVVTKQRKNTKILVEGWLSSISHICLCFAKKCLSVL